MSKQDCINEVILILLAKPMSIAAIAKQLHVSKDRVTAVRDAAGMLPARPPTKHDPDNCSAIRDAGINGMPIEEIKSTFNVSGATIAKYWKIEPRIEPQRRGPRKSATAKYAAFCLSNPMPPLAYHITREIINGRLETDAELDARRKVGYEKREAWEKRAAPLKAEIDAENGITPEVRRGFHADADGTGWEFDDDNSPCDEFGDPLLDK